MAPNLLYYGDNLDVLRQHVSDASVDLVYLDPPFNSSATYNVLFADHDTKSAAQIRAFEDTWRWDEAAAYDYQTAVEQGGRVADALRAFRTLLGTSDMLAYLSMMAPRLVELQRVMKPTASIYLHCDPTASHYLKLLMDSVFGADNFRNEIVWRRTGAHAPKKSFGPLHDTLLFYSKTSAYYFHVLRTPYMRGHVEGRYKADASGRMKFTSGGNVLTGAGKTGGESGQPWQGFDPSAKNRHWAVPGFLTEQMPPTFAQLGVLAKLDALYEAKLIDVIPGTAWPTPVRFLGTSDGQPISDIWAYQPYTEGTVFGTEAGIDADVGWMGPTDPERLGYPTQKPLGLLERAISSSCPADGIVLDPFCGCGTTIAAAEKLNRRWIGIDITHLAIGLIKHRLVDTYGPTITATYSVIGEPTDVGGAEQLAKDDPFQFQAWALGLVGARVASSAKKGGDQGIDGRLYFHDDAGSTATTKQVVFSVKAGHLVPAYLRDLRGVVDREQAQIGVLLSFEQPSTGMRAEAASAGFYDSPFGGRFPRLQLLTVGELLDGKGVDYPHLTGGNVTHRRAPRAGGAEQPNLGL
jgi:site-specific DNA-methyltransferase (adenine-specific)